MITQSLAALLILSFQQVATSLGQLEQAISTSREATECLAAAGNRLSRT
jgi:hypothetical protein